MERSAGDTRQLVRALLAVFVVGLALSGITAFPLVYELNLLAAFVGPVTSASSGLVLWIHRVDDALIASSQLYPFLAYGTDWLAFSHLVIAMFFVGTFRDPVRNAWVIDIGLVACLGVFLIAMICGPIRGIPFYWRLIDCSFGVFAGILLLWIRTLTKGLARKERQSGQA